jgi:hypothetical protein
LHVYTNLYTLVPAHTAQIPPLLRKNVYPHPHTPGTLCDAGSTSTTPCPIGFACPAQNNTQVECPERGYLCFGGGRAPLELAECPLGFYCPVSSLPPTACPPGFTTVATASWHVDNCTCAINGFYESVPGVQCTACAAGQYCPAGDPSNPYACPTGSYCPAGTPAPIQADVGFYAPANSGIQLPCVDGQLCPAGTGPAPTPCPDGFYCEGSFTAVPVECEFGYVCKNGIRTQCLRSAFYAGAAGTVLVQTDEYCPGKALPITKLPAYGGGGYISDNPPSFQCAHDYPAYLGAIDGVRGTATIVHANGTIECAPCPADHYSEYDYYLTYARMEVFVCTPCIAHTRSEVGQAIEDSNQSPLHDCTAEPGWYLDAASQTMFPCPANTYHPYPGTRLVGPDFCEPCPGNSVSGPNSTSCDACADGWSVLPYCDVSTGDGGGGGGAGNQIGNSISTGYGQTSGTFAAASRECYFWIIADPSSEFVFWFSMAGDFHYAPFDYIGTAVGQPYTEIPELSPNRHLYGGTQGAPLSTADHSWESPAFSEDGSRVYMFHRNIAGSTDSQYSVVYFEFATNPSTGTPHSPLSDWGTWHELLLLPDPPCGTMTAGPDRKPMFSSFARNNKVGDNTFYFSHLECVGYVDADTPSFHVSYTYATPPLTEDIVEGTFASGLPSLAYTFSTGRVSPSKPGTEAFTLWPWQDQKFVALSGQYHYTTSEQAICRTGTYGVDMMALFVVDFAAGEITRVIGSTTSAIPCFYPSRGAMNAPPTYGIGTAVKLWRPTAFVADRHSTNGGYFVHGGLVAYANLVTGEAFEVADPYSIASDLSGGTFREASVICPQPLLIKWDIDNAPTSTDFQFRGQVRHQGRSFLITVQCDAGNVFAENECAISDVPACDNLTASGFTCPIGQVVGECNNQGAWTCNACPRAGAVSSFETYVAPGTSCSTQCIAAKNTPVQNTDGYIYYAQYTTFRDYDANNPPISWSTSLPGLYEAPTRCATCWVGGLGYLFAAPSDASSFVRCEALSAASGAKCPLDAYSTGVQIYPGYDYCIECPAGTFSDGKGSSVGSCQACRENSYINENGACVPCPDPLQTTQGQLVVTGVGFCVCPFTKVSTQNNTVCAPCPEGYLCYENVPGQVDNTTVVPCPVGYACTAGWAQYPAPIGYYAPNEGTPVNGWIPCPPGTLCTEFATSVPPPCPSTYHCDGRDQFPCPAGSNCEGTGLVGPCPIDKYCPGHPTAPLACPPDSYRSSDGTTCLCRTNLYLRTVDPGTGVVSCAACPDGFFCVDTVATPCPVEATASEFNVGGLCGAKPGYYVIVDDATGNFTILECPYGTYSPYSGVRGDSLCLPCPGNQWTLGTASSVCDTCRDGWTNFPACLTAVPPAAVAPPATPTCDAGYYLGHHTPTPGTPPVCVACPHQPAPHQAPYTVWVSPGKTCEIACAAGFVFEPAGTGYIPLNQTYTPLEGTGFCHACDTNGGYRAVWDRDMGTFLGCRPLDGGVSGVCPRGSHPVTVREAQACRRCNAGEFVQGGGCSTCSLGFYCPDGTDLPIPMPINSRPADFLLPGRTDFFCVRGHYKRQAAHCCSHNSFEVDDFCECILGYRGENGTECLA